MPGNYRDMLTDCGLNHILSRLPALRVGVLGDLFLDRYLDIDASLTEPSIETGLDAYQVVRARCYPGAAGTVINNLAAFGVQRIYALSVIGDDGEGYELRRAFQNLGIVDIHYVHLDAARRTPTYTKPMVHEAGRLPRELNRLDIKNYSPLTPDVEAHVIQALKEIWPLVDALLVLDQTDHGVVTDRVVQCLAELGEAGPERLILADSRARIAQFRWVWLKPNQSECVRGIRAVQPGLESVEACAAELARRTGRPVFCTCGDRGICVVDPRPGREVTHQVRAYPVTGPIDIVGAGDSTSAALACAVAAGASLAEAAAFGNLVASITIRQLGITGTASPAQIRERWQEVRGS